MGVVKIPVGVVTMELERYNIFPSFFFYDLFFLTETFLEKGNEVLKWLIYSFCNHYDPSCSDTLL